MSEIEILTTEDAEYWRKEDPEFLEAVRKAISLESLFHGMDALSGRQVGHTQKTYDDFMARRKPHDCDACGGQGTVLPKARSVGTIHPSGANRCVLALYNDVLAVVQPREEISPGMRVTFDFGHVVHARIQSTLHQVARWDLQRELASRGLEKWDAWTKDFELFDEKIRGLDFDFEDEARISLPDALIDGGHTDGVFEASLHVLGDDVRVRGILEIKTMSEKEYEKLAAPKTDHRVQAHGLYATAMDCPFIDYIYVAKVFDFTRIFTREFVEVYDAEVYDDWARRKLDPVERALESGKPPTADADSRECGFCKYGWNCTQKRGFGSGSRRLRR